MTSKVDMQEEIKKIVDETIARTCSLFGGSLSDLEPEDQEIEVKTVKKLLTLITKIRRQDLEEVKDLDSKIKSLKK